MCSLFSVSSRAHRPRNRNARLPCFYSYHPAQMLRQTKQTRDVTTEPHVWCDYGEEVVDVASDVDSTRGGAISDDGKDGVLDEGVGMVGRSRRDRFFFFFSSRRRHTRLQGDWSSDVCSSD